MQLSDFSFELPEKFIAHKQMEPRDHSKLMVIDKTKKTISHHSFFELPNLLPENSFIVRNSSKVQKARLRGSFASGSNWELFFLGLKGKKAGIFLVKPGKKFPEGEPITITTHTGKTLQGQVRNIYPGGEREIVFLNLEQDLDEFLEKHGEVPLPPYIESQNPNNEEKNYQTVYAKEKGSVAAPTAGLHFTKEVFTNLRNKGIESLDITLHVGLGTFLPVKSDVIEEHTMHSENFFVKKETLIQIQQKKSAGEKLLAIGTTSTRVLEHLENTYHFLANPDALKDMPEILTGSTDIFIYPPYKFSCVDMLLTNFHLPKSSLLMLVSSFLEDREFLFHAYEEAKKNDYRFYSFGDAMLII